MGKKSVNLPVNYWEVLRWCYVQGSIEIRGKEEKIGRTRWKRRKKEDREEIRGVM